MAALILLLGVGLLLAPLSVAQEFIVGGAGYTAVASSSLFAVVAALGLLYRLERGRRDR